MKNELTKQETALVEMVDTKEIGSLLKPMIDEIHLFDTFIAHTSFTKNPDLYKTLEIGTKLNLIREKNKFDENTIKICDSNNQTYGIIPEKDTIIFARLMDAGKCLIAKVKNVQMVGNYPQVEIGIYMIDF